MLSELKRELATARSRMVHYANKTRSEWEFIMGDAVFLKVRRFLQLAFTKGAMSKFSPKYFGPYAVVEKVGEVAYRLQLPEDVRIHLVFHVSLLKKSRAGTTANEASLPPLEEGNEGFSTVVLPLMEEESEEPIVPRAIVDKRVIYRGAIPITQVLVRWSHLPTRPVDLGIPARCIDKIPHAINLF